MTMKYHSGLKNSHTNTLSQRNQDNPNKKNEQMSHQFFQLLKSTSASLFGNEKDRTEAVLTMAVIMTSTVMMSISTDECNRIKQLWISSAYNNTDYIKAWQAIKEEARQFPPELNLKALITECQADDNNTLQFRNQH